MLDYDSKGVEINGFQGKDLYIFKSSGTGQSASGLLGLKRDQTQNSFQNAAVV
jgi:hypothetical protein